MDDLRQEEIDSLAGLEERIRRAVELVSVLKREKEAMAAQVEAAVAARGLAEDEVPGVGDGELLELHVRWSLRRRGWRAA